MDEFLRWYTADHLPNVMRIPGIVKAYRSACHRGSVNWVSLYELESDDALRLALASAEADRARRDWDAWLPHVSHLSIEIYTRLTPLALFHHHN
jgi:hypothetical protein